MNFPDKKNKVKKRLKNRLPTVQKQTK